MTMISTESIRLQTAPRAAARPVTVAMPGPIIRPDTPALRAFAGHLRALACRTERTEQAARRIPGEHPPCSTVPGAFALLVADVVPHD